MSNAVPEPASTVADAFALYDENLKLDPDELARARERHQAIRDVLRSAGIIDDAFLQGSFRRKTMLAPLKDVDMVVILAAAHEHLHADPEGPAQSVNLLAPPLADAYPHANLEPGCHALKIDFGDEGFTFDAVPAFECHNSNGDVEIADVDQRRWELSNTRELIRVIQDRNQSCGGHWVHQARMMKDFVANALRPLLPAKLPGLISESICYAAITTVLPHPEALATALRTGARMLLGAIEDPTGFDVLTEKLEPGVQQGAQQAFQRAAELAEQALRLAAAGDEGAAVDTWHSILGNGFPSAPPPTTDEAIAGLLSGGVTSTGRPTRVRDVNVTARPTRAWRCH